MPFDNENFCEKEVHNLQLVDAFLDQGEKATAVVAFTSLEHKELYRLRYCIKWSDAIGNEKFNIKVGIDENKCPVSYPVFGCDDQVVTIGRLRRRLLLILKFVSPNNESIVPHFVLESPIFPQIIRTREICCQEGEESNRRRNSVNNGNTVNEDSVVSDDTTNTGTDNPNKGSGNNNGKGNNK